jgi:phosphatidylglycerol---prolipoprotein diacylglyceryl transferase
MRDYYVHDMSVSVLTTSRFVVTYYDIFMLATVVLGYAVLVWQLRRGGYSWKLTLAALPVLAFSFIFGARVVHCLLYDPQRYIARPLSILVFWKGGYASHGAGAALLIALAVMARVVKAPVLDLYDRGLFPVAVGATLVRVGNFFHSEIVGRATDVPWAMRFMRFDGGMVPRHPSQLYEAVFGALVLAMLFSVDALVGREQRPRGLLAGLLLLVYFSGRFALEFFKEYQALDSSTSPLTMGHYLSLIGVLVGAGILLLARRGAADD